MSNIKKHSKEGEQPIPHIEPCPAYAVTTKYTTNTTTIPCAVIQHPVISVNISDETAQRILSDANKENDGNYDEPVLNTILEMNRQLQELHLAKPQIKGHPGEEMSPRTKAAVIPKISQKLNFPHDKTVFRNLIPINVNDCNLLPKKKLSIRKKYIKSKQRVPTPDLGDFLDPLPPLEHIIPEPDLDLIYGQAEIDVFAEFFEFYREVNPRWIRSEHEM